MKILNKESNTVIEIKDKNRIEKLLGYPDKFEEVKEEKKKVVKDNKEENIQNNEE